MERYSESVSESVFSEGFFSSSSFFSSLVCAKSRSRVSESAVRLLILRFLRSRMLYWRWRLVAERLLRGVVLLVRLMVSMTGPLRRVPESSKSA